MLEYIITINATLFLKMRVVILNINMSRNLQAIFQLLKIEIMSEIKTQQCSQLLHLETVFLFITFIHMYTVNHSPIVYLWLKI